MMIHDERTVVQPVYRTQLGDNLGGGERDKRKNARRKILLRNHESNRRNDRNGMDGVDIWA